MKINFDKELKIDNTAEINLYGKQLKIVFNDDFRRKISAARLKIESYASKFDDEDYVKEISSKPYKEQEKIANNFMNQSKNVVLTAVDEILGAGIGEFLYKHFDGSTEAVSAVLAKLEEKADEAIKDTQAQERKAKLSKYKNHH